MDDILEFKKIINESNNIVFFGGAGVSTDSGIKDFRSNDGLYSKDFFGKSPEYMLSSQCFFEDTKGFYSYYKMNLNSLDVLPNVTHKALVKLEKQGKLKAIITQNIDGLHQKAGSKNVLEIHGTTYTNHCLKCNKEYNAEYVFNSKGIPKCSCGGIIKPDVTLYGESLPPAFDDAIDYIRDADTLIVCGTSLKVYPAAGLIDYFHGKNLIIINKDKTPYDDVATLVINRPMKDVFSKI
jgi:NAD-dependent deacetylase